jgi:hypothetical protein
MRFQYQCNSYPNACHWQTDTVLDADDIATLWFPGVKTTTTILTGTTTVPTDELMKNLIDSHALLASTLNPTTF